MTITLRNATMTIPLRLALVAITLALTLATFVRGTPEGRMLTASLLGPDLRDVQLLGLSAQERHPPALMTERVRSDLTAPATGAERLYVPEADQGERFVTSSGLRWWGAAPERSGPMPAVILLHGAGKDGLSLVDMWHETAMAQGFVVIAPDMSPAPPPDAVGPYDARIAVEVLEHARAVFDIDPDRIALFGDGRGAVAAQVWANRIDGPWRAVAAHGATVDPQTPQPVGRGVPVRLYLGSEHPAEPVGSALVSGTAMARAGHAFELIRMRGHDDWFYGVGERVAEDAWLWLSDRLGPTNGR
jgi:predicted esterase